MPAARAATAPRGKPGQVVQPREFGYVERSPGGAKSPSFPPLKLTNGTTEAGDEDAGAHWRSKGSAKATCGRGQLCSHGWTFDQRGAFTATLLSEMRDNIHDSLDAVAGERASPEVSELMWGRSSRARVVPKGGGGFRGHQPAIDDAAQLGAKLSSIHNGISGGNSAAASEYNRRRAAQMEQFRGTPEPAMMSVEWRTEASVRAEGPAMLDQPQHAHDSFRAGSAEPGVLMPTVSFNPRSLTPLRDAQTTTAAVAEKTGEMFDGFPLLNNQHRNGGPPHGNPEQRAATSSPLLPRHMPVFRAETDSALVQLSVPNAALLAQLRMNKSSSERLRPVSRSPAPLTKQRKTWIGRSTSTTPNKEPLQSRSTTRRARSQATPTEEAEEAAPPPRPRLQRRSLDLPPGAPSASERRLQMRKLGDSPAGVRVLEKLERLEKNEGQLNSLLKEIEEEKEALRKLKYGARGGPEVDILERNKEAATRRMDETERERNIREKEEHLRRVKEKAREAKEERRMQQLYAAERADRIRQAAQEQRKREAALQRARTMLPIVVVVSHMDALAARLIRYRQLEKMHELKVYAVITIQKYLRGFKQRQKFKAMQTAAIFLQRHWRNTFYWILKIKKRRAANKLISFMRDVHNQSDFIGAIKVAIHRIVKENRKKNQMKTLSRGIMTTVLRGQWSKQELEEIARKKNEANIRSSRFLKLVSAAAGVSSTELPSVQEDGEDAARPPVPERKAAPKANAPPKPKLGGMAAGMVKGKFGGGGLKSIVNKHQQAVQRLAAQSMPNASTVMDNFTPVPDLAKLMVIESFINLRAQQYVRVMGLHWLNRAKYLRKRRTFERNRGNPNYKAQPPVAPVLLPMPRGSRASELRVMMQQGVYEAYIMGEEGGWDLEPRRERPSQEGEAMEESHSVLSPKEQERAMEVMGRLRTRLFMCNISIKAGLLRSWKVGGE